MTLIRTILSIFFVLLCTVDAPAAKPHHFNNSPSILAIPATWEQYEREIKKFPEQIKQFDERVQKIDDPEFYKYWRAHNASTGKTQKFSDLNSIAKQVLYLYHSEVLEGTLASKSAAWIKMETHLLQYPSIILLPPEATDEQKKKAEKQEEQNKKSRQKLAEDLLKLRIQLIATRTSLAVKRVQIIESMIKKHKDERFVDELKRYLDHTKKYYNKVGLSTEAPKEKKLPKKKQPIKESK